MRMAEPVFLGLLALLPMAALLLWRTQQWRQATLARWFDQRVLVRSQQLNGPNRTWLDGALWMTILATAAVGMAQPERLEGDVLLDQRGTDLIVALDISSSMRVADGDTTNRLSRLERAKRKLYDFLKVLKGDRVGLVVFSGEAFLECPLTLDYRLVEKVLDAVDPTSLLVQGTNLADALKVSREALERSNSKSGAIILITDGEDHSEALTNEIEQVAESGLRVYAIGIGRDEGAPVPDAQGQFRRDRQGRLILSRLNEDTLRRISRETGGRYARSTTGDVDLDQIYLRGIRLDTERSSLTSHALKDWRPLYQWLLACTVLLLMIQPFWIRYPL